MARPLIFCWPKGHDIDEIARLESSLGIHFDGRRERGGRGTLDSGLYKEEAYFNQVFGSFDLQSRTGRTSPPSTIEPVPFAEITSGAWDSSLANYCAQFLELMASGMVVPSYIEFQSEANIVNDVQPGPEWFTGGAEAFIYTVKFFRAHGVKRKYLKWILSVTRGVFDNHAVANSYFDPLISADVLDLIGVDAYDHTYEGGKSRSFVECFAPAAAYAQSKGKQMAICETGVGESPNDANYKANWYTDAFSWINATKRSACRFVCFSGEDPWVMDSSPQAAAAFVDGMKGA